MKIIKKLNFSKKKILIITGKNSFTASKLGKDLKVSNCEIYYFYKKNKVPEVRELKKIINKKQQISPDIIIGVGGGSVLDLSKMTAALNETSIEPLNLKKIKFKKNVKLILIPTTAGSGSEATNFAVLYKNKKKYSLVSNQMFANKIYFKPNVLANLRKKEKLASALDILCQATESIFSKKSNRSSLLYASKALKIYKNFISNYLLGKSKTYKSMLIAANYSGKAINITKTNVPHALSYYLTSTYKIEHGYAVYLNFFGFINFLYQKKNNNIFLKKRFSFLFRQFKVSKKEKYPLNILFLKLISLINTTISYKKFLINKNQEVKKIINSVNLVRLKNCPIVINSNDLREIVLFDITKFLIEKRI
jgi:alcohol dehydrogenase class IV